MLLSGVISDEERRLAMMKTCNTMSKRSPVDCTIKKCTDQPCIVKRRIQFNSALSLFGN